MVLKRSYLLTKSCIPGIVRIVLLVNVNGP